jgi:hypothetical protein
MSKVVGFICGTGELDLSLGATDVIIYPTIESLKEARDCWSECGIVEVHLGKFVEKPMSLEQIIENAREEALTLDEALTRNGNKK